MDLLTTDISRNRRLKSRPGKAQSLAPNIIKSQNNRSSNKKSNLVNEEDPDFEGVVLISKRPFSLKVCRKKEDRETQDWSYEEKTQS